MTTKLTPTAKWFPHSNEAHDLIKVNSQIKCSLNQVLPELEEYLKQFFNWLRSKEKKAESLSMKIDLYSFVLKKYKSIAREWIKTLQDKKEPHFKSFVKKNLIGEAEYNQCIEATSQYLRQSWKRKCLKHFKDLKLMWRGIL